VSERAESAFDLHHEPDVQRLPQACFADEICNESELEALAADRGEIECPARLLR
jgi:hypothetical protein